MLSGEWPGFRIGMDARLVDRLREQRTGNAVTQGRTWSAVLALAQSVAMGFGHGDLRPLSR